MEVVEHVHGYRGVFHDGGYERGRHVSGNVFYHHAALVHLQPEILQGVHAAAVAHVYYAPAVKVYDYGLVRLPLPYGELVYPDVPHAAYVRVCVLAGQAPFVNVLDRIPSKVQEPGRRFYRREAEHVHHHVFQPCRVAAFAVGEMDVLVPVTSAGLAAQAVYLRMKHDGNAPYRYGLEVAVAYSVFHYVAAFAFGTAHFVGALLDVQHYFAIFVAITGPFVSLDAEGKG